VLLVAPPRAVGRSGLAGCEWGGVWKRLLAVDVADVFAALGAWDFRISSVRPLAGGLNSVVWAVRGADGAHYVAKLADVESAEAFRTGLRVAERAARRGIRSGPPVPLPGGPLSLTVTAGELALLEYVPGRGLDPTCESDWVRAGAMLAQAHAALASDVDCIDPELRWPWPWADHALTRIPMAAELRGAAGRALQDARRVTERDGLRVQVVHGDPAADAFRLAPATGTTDDRHRDGLIDWAATMTAPALYDIGTVAAVNAAHSDRLHAVVRGYGRTQPATPTELRRLPTFTRLRWMCVALYFADRIARGIVRGGSADANQRGLTEARARLTSAGS
jgi:Ser/Thr protein kinase RdoA (MazF antagonist)